MTVVVLDSAEAHLADGARFYESQSEGLGRYFLESLLGDLRRLERYGGIHPIVHGLHRSISARFPSEIFYSIEGNLVRVHAVLDGRRHPAWIRRQLRDL